MKDYIKAFVNVDGVINQVKIYEPLFGFDYSKPIKGLTEKVPTPYLKRYTRVELANGECYTRDKEFKFAFDLEDAKQGKYHSRPIATKLFIEFVYETQDCEEELLELAEYDEKSAMALAWGTFLTIIYFCFGKKKLVQTICSVHAELYFWNPKELRAEEKHFHILGIDWATKSLWCGDVYGEVLDLVGGEFLREDLGNWYKSEKECRERNAIQVLLFAD